MAATVTLTYQIPRNSQSRSAQQSVISGIVLGQGEQDALGLTITSDLTTYFSGVIYRTVVMQSPNPADPNDTARFEQQFKTTAAQESAVNRLFLGRLQYLAMADVTQQTSIVITP